jgi:hypothetical protein
MEAHAGEEVTVKIFEGRNMISVMLSIILSFVRK